MAALTDAEQSTLDLLRLWLLGGLTTAPPVGASINADTVEVDIAGGYAEDAAHTTGHEGLFILVVRRDAASAGSGTDGDYSSLNVDANGRLRVIDDLAGTPTHTADAIVDDTAGGVEILAALATRKRATIQNTGLGNMRVSVGGVPTASAGIQLLPGATTVLDRMDGCALSIKAIAETATDAAAGVVSVV